MTNISHELPTSYKERLSAVLGSDVEFGLFLDEQRNHDKTSGAFYYLRSRPLKRTTEPWQFIAVWELIQLPGCCGVCVSTAAFVYHDYRKKGIGTLLNELRIDQARAKGYGVLLCTDVSYNEAQRKILAKNNWRDIYDFVNPRTGNRVYMSIKTL